MVMNFIWSLTQQHNTSLEINIWDLQLRAFFLKRFLCEKFYSKAHNFEDYHWFRQTSVMFAYIFSITEIWVKIQKFVTAFHFVSPQSVTLPALRLLIMVRHSRPCRPIHLFRLPLFALHLLSTSATDLIFKPCLSVLILNCENVSFLYTFA
jgi:hypothetical protein